MKPRRERRGRALVDLLVALLIVGFLTAALVPALANSHSSSRRAQCLNNMRNIALALNIYALRNGAYPAAGTFFETAGSQPTADRPEGDVSKSVLNSVGDVPAAADVPRAARSWVVDILMDLDEAILANGWDRERSYLATGKAPDAMTANVNISRTALAILRCPDDVNFTPNEGNLSYVVNGGFARFAAVPHAWRGGATDGTGDGRILRWDAVGSPAMATKIHKRLGVMFLQSVWDAKSSAPDAADVAPENDGRVPSWGGLKTTATDLVDGAGMTILVGETTLAGFSTGNAHSAGAETNWAAPWPTFCMFLASDDVCGPVGDCASAMADGARLPESSAWRKANQDGSRESIGHGRSMKTKGGFPFANSGHTASGVVGFFDSPVQYLWYSARGWPGATHFAFCDGSVRAVRDGVDGDVYARIITPAGGGLPSPFQQGPVDRDALDW